MTLNAATRRERTSGREREKDHIVAKNNQLILTSFVQMVRPGGYTLLIGTS